MKLNTLRAAWGAAFLSAVMLPSVSATTVSIGSSSDTYIRFNTSHTVAGVSTFLDSRQLGFVPYIQFDMSALNIDAISSATLRLWKVAGSRNDGINNARFATYGLDDDAGNTLQNWHETNDFNPSDATNGLDFRNVGLDWTNTTAGVDRNRLTSLDPQDGGVTVTETVNNTTGEIVLSGADLVAFLNSRVDAGGLVTFLLPLEDAADRGYGIASRQNATASLQPLLELEYTEIPEPASLILLVLAAGSSILRRK